MKIGISNIYLDAMGGGEKYILSLASCLSEKDEVDLFWDTPQILEKSKKRFSINLDRLKTVPNIFSPSYSTFSRLMETRKYDLLIHLSDGSIPFSLAKKTVLHIQHPINWVSASLLDQVKLTSIHSILCNSEYTKRSVEAIFKKPCTVLYPPCQMIGEGGKKEDIILTVGRYNKLEEGGDFKKLGEMMSHFKEYVDKTNSSYSFILVVTYKKKDEEAVNTLKESIGRYKIQILSDLSNEELGLLYKRAKIYWHAAGYQEDLDLHPERAEHFGISVVEAMSAGAVPVVINAGGIPEIITNTENGFLWNTKGELFNYTKQVSEQKDLYEKVKENAIKRAKDFSEESFFDQVKKLFL